MQTTRCMMVVPLRMLVAPLRMLVAPAALVILFEH
jgi:hypothetical protein